MKVYALTVTALGLITVLIGAADMIPQLAQHDWRVKWLSLVGLTVATGLLPVSLPSVNVSISVSETFVIAGTLLFGPAGGTALVFLDSLVLTTRLLWTKALKWEQVLFNLAAPSLSICCAALAVGIRPLFETTPAFSASFVLTLAGFTLLYFLFSSWLLAFAVALERGGQPHRIWATHFRDMAVNYTAGASIAALLVYNTRTVDFIFVGATVPLLVLMYFTYFRSNKSFEAERERNVQLNRVFMSTVEALALAIDAKDQVTHGHIRRVQRHALALASALGLRDAKQLDAIRAAALLHDTGKLAVPEYILNKPGPLTAAEFERMKVHAAVGADILKPIDFPYPVEPIVRHHHENWNGTGYPDGLREQQIPLGARMLSVVDCYDALTSDRPYRPRYARRQAEQILRERRGVMYDPWIVDTFLGILDTLEQADLDDMRGVVRPGTSAQTPIPHQLAAITATQAEEREFSELRRDLLRAPSLRSAADILLGHVRRLLPATSLAHYVHSSEIGELRVVAWSGASTLDGLRIAVGERISGWAFAHRQVVMNSDATLELGPVAKAFPVPLRYAMAVPIDGQAPGVVAVYASDPFDNDHRRMLETATTLFASSVSFGPPADSVDRGDDAGQARKAHVH